jgi:molecular chaperone DnaK (HSP70)
MFIGIDLGTTHCCIAYKNPKTNQTEVIDDPMKHVKSIPSVICCSDNEFQYSFDAINTKRAKPESCLYDAKRFIGRTFNNVSQNFVINKMNFELEKVNDKPTFKVNYRDKTVNLFPEQVSALLLRHLKTIAEDFLGKKIEGCVITVPAHFNNTEREATLFAAEMADLKVLQLLNEPSAAALSYGLQSQIDGYLLIFDYGGGTLDVSVVRKQDDKYEVVGYAGDQILGGRDIDDKVFDYCIKEFQKMYQIQPNDRKQKAILLEKCENAKIALSSRNKIEAKIFDWSETNSIRLSKDKFEELCQPFFKKAIELLEKFLNKLNIEKKEIAEIVMTGGSSYIPLIQKMVEDFLGKKRYVHEPEAAIAKGAAWVAFNYSQNLNNFVLRDQVRYSIGIEIMNSKPVNINISDKSLRLEFRFFGKIVESRAKIPCKETKKFTTLYDNQTGMSIKVAEGDSNFFAGNTLIDSFVLENLPRGKAGEVFVDVTIEINKSGLLLVTATETSNKQITKSKEMRREGNYYRENEKNQIKESFLSLLN